MELDTIVAIVTPPGEGGVGIVRTSGPLTESIAARLFPRLRSPWPSHRLRQSTLVDPSTSQPLDEAVGVVMRAPRSYTAEDVLEIHCHGSPLLLERVVAICLEAGCRQARPGEFTLRAFLNGRLDLAQAEAVLDVVRARTNVGLQLAVRQLEGWLTERIEPVRHDLVGILAHLEAMVDFVEDDIPPQADPATRARLAAALHTVEPLLAGAEQGIILREGAALTIAGSPNVGKSSLMNALLGMDRSIVTPIAGTTRDTIEETLQIRGIPFRTVDTAGMTNSTDPVEQIGVERSRRAITNADVILFVVDRSRPWSPQDDLALTAVEDAGRTRETAGSAPRVVIALNKADLPPAAQPPAALDRLSPVAVVESSALKPAGIEALRTALETAAIGGGPTEWITGNVRHHDALRRAAAALHTALAGLNDGTPLDLISFDVRAAAAALGEITGAQVDDELLDRIFREFCIGK